MVRETKKKKGQINAHEIEQKCVTTRPPSFFHAVMRDCWKGIRDSQDEVQLFLLHIFKPTRFIGFALCDSRPELCDTFLVPAFNESSIDFIPPNISNIKYIEVSQKGWELEHTHCLYNANVIGFEVMHRLCCSFPCVPFSIRWKHLCK